MAGMALWRTLVRDDVLRELTFTHREFTASEGLGLGFVTRLTSDPHAEALRVAREIAAKSPLAIRAAKTSFAVTETLGLREGYRFEQSATVALSRTEDTREAQRAFAEKRKPNFKGR
jgi:enoyl-CoA hydratase/carnithine racemase